MKEEVFNKCAIRMKYANYLIVDKLLNNGIGYIDYTEQTGKKDSDFKVVITLRDKKLRKLHSKLRESLADLLWKDVDIWRKYLGKIEFSTDGMIDFSKHKSDLSIPIKFTNEYHHYIHRNNMFDNTMKCAIKVTRGYFTSYKSDYI